MPLPGAQEHLRTLRGSAGIEGEVDEYFDAGLSRLRTQLRAGEIDTIAYIDRKELYELLEEVVDKCAMGGPDGEAPRRYSA
jgi:uncharacterized protein Yka (UPF0111/DUF47 family)